MQRALFILGLVTLGAMSLTGCASLNDYGSTPQSLDIRILPNTSKQFIYRIGRDGADPGPRISPEGRQPQPRMPGRRDYEKLQARTGYVVAATGYCREGYLELDFRLSAALQWVRGECREGATDADIERFGSAGDVALDQLAE